MRKYYRVKEVRHILKKKMANWISHVLHRNCLLKHCTAEMIQGKTEVAGRKGRRCKLLLDNPKKIRGYCKLKKEAPSQTSWRTRFGRGYGPVARQKT
jgi:hypothetical protein